VDFDESTIATYLRESGQNELASLFAKRFHITSPTVDDENPGEFSPGSNSAAISGPEEIPGGWNEVKVMRQSLLYGDLSKTGVRKLYDKLGLTFPEDYSSEEASEVLVYLLDAHHNGSITISNSGIPQSSPTKLAPTTPQNNTEKPLLFQEFSPSAIPLHESSVAKPPQEQQQDSPWRLTPEMRTLYDGFFAKADKDTQGLIPGTAAKQMFTRSRLSVDILVKIWELSDQDKDGRLTKREFFIAMHLINLARKNIEIPTQVPQALLDSISPNADRTILGEIKKVFDMSNKGGVLTGEFCKAFFLKSNLHPTELAQIWTLTDAKFIGCLTIEEFTVAIYLISNRLKGRPIPSQALDSFSILQNPAFTVDDLFWLKV